jgi:uncharacterized protein (DUF433 family)
MSKIPRIKPKPNPPQCKICASPQRNAINQRIVRGDSIQSIAKDFGCCRLTMMRHAGVGNDKHGVPHKAHYVSQVMVAKARMDGKAGLDLMTCQQKVWDDAQEAVDYALGRKAPPETNPLNLAVFGQCIAPQVKIIEVLAKVEEKPAVTQTTTVNNYDNLSKDDIKDLIRLTAKIEGSEEGVGEEKPT